jgi:hypothetical protein
MALRTKAATAPAAAAKSFVPMQINDPDRR